MSAGEYRCPAITARGVVCGAGCRDPQGCRIHRGRLPRVPCCKCGTPTTRPTGVCSRHPEARTDRTRKWRAKKAAELAAEQYLQSFIDSGGVDFPSSESSGTESS